jgi:hypothetical protein
MLKRAVLGLALGGLTAGIPVIAGEGRPAPNSLYDVVAVGRSRGQIILATPAAPRAEHRWRFRAVPLNAKAATPEGVALARSGTKIVVVLPGGTTEIVDLTQRLSGEKPAGRAGYRLPGQWFPVAQRDTVCLVNDAGEQAGAACRSARSAAVHEDGRALYAAPDGQLYIARAGESERAALPYRVPPGSRFELMAGLIGDARDFLVLVERGGAVEVVDPAVANGVLGRYARWEEAGLHATLALHNGGSGEDAQASSDDAIGALAANLLQDAPRGVVSWSFFRVAPELPLYAPVLEFAKDEPAYPSDTAIWDTLNPMTRGTTREAYQEAYDSLGKERWRRCKVYFRATSYPGSWLLEYWYYYPFDEGRPHRHIHDSEHVFIEVDKLGGAVRSFLASDHGQFAPNNGYSTFLPGAKPIDLPLFALVEFEKHAMSPDINRDGQFSQGVDVNLYREKYAVWGLRDTDSSKDHLMKPYRPWMSLPRRAEDRFALESSADYFPDLEVDPEKATCGLLPFPEDPPCKDCTKATVENAAANLTAHEDARRPEDIYKPWVLPYHQVRVGIGLFDHFSNQRQLYGAYVGDLVRMTRGLVSLPGRLSLEVMWSPASQQKTTTQSGSPLTTRFSSATYFGARYERLLTSTQGFYFGATPLFLRATPLAPDGTALRPSQWGYDSTWYRAGYIFELPFQHKGNMTHHVGLLFAPQHRMRMEWRVSLGTLRRRGRNSFGIRPADPNPYQ